MRYALGGIHHENTYSALYRIDPDFAAVTAAAGMAEAAGALPFFQEPAQGMDSVAMPYRRL
ncbi:MAG: hypothetical protein JW801_00965 [Bacteroidales bacterium]|nr:hypothetical protein [Bacteroidales bacterium]